MDIELKKKEIEYKFQELYNTYLTDINEMIESKSYTNVIFQMTPFTARRLRLINEMGYYIQNLIQEFFEQNVPLKDAEQLYILCRNLEVDNYNKANEDEVKCYNIIYGSV